MWLIISLVVVNWLITAYMLVVAAGSAFHQQFDTAISTGLTSFAPAFIGLIFFVFWKLSKKHEAEETEFIIWLIENADSVRRGTARFKGHPIKMDTKVTQYLTCVSVIVLTQKIPTSLLISGSGSARIAGVFNSLIALTCGWWGIPWGPIFTIESLFKNTFGGCKRTVSDILQSVELELPHAVRRAEAVDDISQRMRRRTN
ncbi:MAG: hypothetical protein K2Z81_18045 [Cyanobacteria bacterium]|nr:hypothetical protein [Cyanobacteriota bacterium]